MPQGLLPSQPSEVPGDRFEAESWLNDPPWSIASGERYPVGRTVVSRCKNGSTFKGYSAHKNDPCLSIRMSELITT